MALLDRSRFIYMLAGALIAEEWTADTLRATVRQTMAESSFNVPTLAAKIFAAFPAKPGFDQLVPFLRAQPQLARAISSKPDIRAMLKAARGRSNAQRVAKMEPPPLRLIGLKIPQLATGVALAEWFGIESQRLAWLADVAGRNRRHPSGPLRVYRYRWIPRREGLPRLLEIPKATLKEMQRNILEQILNRVPAHPAVHGFCAERSIVTNAALHCGKAAVLRFDLVDFFPSVTSARVFRIFRTLGYPAQVARLLTGLCTTQLPGDVWDARPSGQIGADFIARQRLVTRHLPQGAPTSPALANLAAHRLDRRLTGLANAAGATYTRYADDLTFSGDAKLARSGRRLETLVAVIAHEEGFALNHRKTRIMRRGVRQKVAGVVVNVHPNIRRAEFDRLKAILTNCVRHGPASQNRGNVPDFRAHLAGKLAHVASINPARGKKLTKIFQRIVWPVL